MKIAICGVGALGSTAAVLCRNLEPTLTTIASDVDVLVIVHPKELPPAALYAIDQLS